jgi:hypothetical protein
MWRGRPWARAVEPVWTHMAPWRQQSVVISLKEWISGFHDLLTQKPSSLFILLGWISISVTSLTTWMMYSETIIYHYRTYHFSGSIVQFLCPLNKSYFI